MDMADATGNDDSQSYFAAARPQKANGIDETLNELKQMQQNLLANRSNQGAPSRGALLRQNPNVLVPSTGAGKFMYVDPRARPYDPMSAYQDEQGHDAAYLQKINDQELLRKLQLLPQNYPNLLMKAAMGNAPRLADDRGDLMRDTENTFYGGGHAPPPSPTPTPPKYFPVSYFT
jgi:hypothetical protein